MNTNDRNGGVPGSQRDELAEARAVDFNVEMHRSITAAAKDPPDIPTVIGAMWSVFRTFQGQMFEQEGLLSHVATETAAIGARAESTDDHVAAIRKLIEKQARTSQPIIASDPEATGRHRAHQDDVTAFQTLVENAARETKGDIYALGLMVSTRLAAVEASIGEAPHPGHEDEKKRKGTGLKRDVASLQSLRSKASLLVTAALGGGGILAVSFELFTKYILPALGHH